MKIVSTTPLSDIDKEIGTLKKWRRCAREWHSRLQNGVSKHPKRALHTIYVLLVIIVVVSVFLYTLYRDAQTLKGELGDDRNVEEDKALNLTFYFYFDKSVEDWKTNRTYPFELHITSNEHISTENMVFFKPLFGKSLKPPVAVNYTDSDFSSGNSDTVKGLVDTTSVDSGWYNICAIIKNKADTNRKVEDCDNKEIKVN